MILVSIFILITTLWSELSTDYKSFLTGITGHHWVTKSVFSTILFFGLYFLLPYKDKKSENEDKLRAAKTIFWTVFIVSIIIFLYYVFYFF
jgi:heme/copper-type cytochrome/quinol oxidase subunit 2